MALPFLVRGNAWPYLTRAFQFDRKFLYQWTVNWKMLGEEIFQSKRLSYFLLGYHVLAIVFFLNDRWVKPSSNNILHFIRQYTRMMPDAREKQVQSKITPMFVMESVLGSIVLGMLCARSLHYQFYVYLGWATPFILWRTGVRPGMIYLVWGAQEMAWLVYPSTIMSSNMVVGLLAIQTLAIWWGSSVDPAGFIAGEEKDKEHAE